MRKNLAYVSAARARTSLAFVEIEDVGVEVHLGVDLGRLLGRIDRRRIAEGDVLHRNARAFGQARLDVHDRAQRDAAAVFEVAPLKIFAPPATKQPSPIVAPDDVGVRSDDAAACRPSAGTAETLPPLALQHRVLHHDRVGAERHRRTLRDDDGAVQHGAARADGHVAARSSRSARRRRSSEPSVFSCRSTES